MPTPFRLILDTNTLLRGLANPASASGQVLELCERKHVTLLLSRQIMLEYRAVLGSPDIKKRNPHITNASVELILRRLRYFSEYTAKVRARFHFDRDKLDEKFIELAISAHATHIITHDNDLLSLSSIHTDAAKRFRQRLPHTYIFQPGAFLREFESL